jgi:hypothetical protein
MYDGLLRLVTAAHAEYVRVCCGSLGGLARRQSPLLGEHVQQHCGCALGHHCCTCCCMLQLLRARVAIECRWPPVWSCVAPGRPIPGVAVSHRCSWSTCTYVVASLVERVVAPVLYAGRARVVVALWARLVPVWACVVPRGRCRIRGPLARMHCGCGLRIRCEGQPQGRCLVSCSPVRLCRCGSGLSVLPQKKACYRN